MNSQNSLFLPTFRFTTLALLALFTLIFLIQIFVPVIGTVLVNIFAFHSDAFLANFFLWQPITAIFFHANLPHFLWNMLFFVFFGNAIAGAWRVSEFVKYFLLCGVAGFLCFFVHHSFFHEQHVIGLGASGGITGLMVAFALIFGETTILAFFFIPMKAKYFVAILLAIEVIMLWSGSFTEVSNIGHLGGAACGYVYIKTVWKRQQNIEPSGGNRILNLEI